MRNKYCYILLLLLLAFHIINNFIIITNDNSPLIWDGSEYFYLSLRYYDVFTNPGSDFISEFYDVSRYRPPLILLSSLPFYLAFGKSADVAVMPNTLFFILLMLSVYGIGKNLHSEKAGLFASFIVSTFPVIFGLSRLNWLDLPVTAMVAVSIYLILKADYFRDRRYSLLFGLSAGLGMLTKWTYFVFLTGPFLYFLISAPLADERMREQVKKRVFNAALSLCICMAVASFWYIPNSWNVVVKLFSISAGGIGEKATRLQQLGETIGPAGIFNIKSFTFYASKLVNEQITFFYAVLFGIFTIILLKRSDRHISWTLLLWIVIPVIAFTLIKNKTTRNTVPMLPAVGLILSIGIMGIKNTGMRRIAAVVVLFVGLFQYAAASYGSPVLPKRLALGTPVGYIVLFQQPENTSHTLFRPNKADWKVDEMLESINADRGTKNNVKIAIIPRDHLTWMSIESYSYLKGMPFTFVGAADEPEAVLDADYILDKKGGFIAPWFVIDNIHRSHDLMDENPGNYSLIKSVVLPEKTRFFTVYDTNAGKVSHKSGIVFSEGLEVKEYSVHDIDEGNKELVVEIGIRNPGNITGELMMEFNMLNKKMEPVMKLPVQRINIDSAVKEEVKNVRAYLTIPPNVAEEFFSLQIGFYDPLRRKSLLYQPEYLVYKRRDTS